MTLINSWKNSLQLLKPASLKQFLRDVAATLPRVYSNYLKILPAIIILMTIPLVAFFYFSQVAAFPYILLGTISIISAIAVLIMYAIVKDAMRNEPTSFKKYLSRFIIGTCVLSIFFALAYYYPLQGIGQAISNIIELRDLGTQRLIKRGMPIPPHSYKSIKMNAELIASVLTMFFSSTIAFFAGFPGFIYIYFLDSTASIQSFLKAMINGIKFLLWNLPGLIVIYAIVVIALFIPTLFLSLSPFILLSFVVASFPLIPTINGQLYKRLKV